MIDTIHIRILNAKRNYSSLFQSMENTFAIDKGRTNASLLSSVNASSYLFNADSFDSYNRKDFYKIKSNHYEVATSYDSSSDCVDFNLSLPKYIFGSNLIHFPFHSQPADISQCAQFVKNFIISFLHSFGISEYAEQDILLNRVDICCNVNYLDDSLRKLFFLNLRKHTSATASSTRNLSMYMNGIFFKSTDWSFKIYDKFVEFNKHDKNILAKQPHVMYNYFCDLSKGVVRYEMTFRYRMLKRYAIYVYLKNMVDYSTYEDYRRFINSGQSIKQAPYFEKLHQALKPNLSFLDGQFLEYLILEFFKKCDLFKMADLSTQELLLSRINDEVFITSKVDKLKLIYFHELLKKYSFNEILQRRLMPKTTAYRYKAFLKSNNLETSINSVGFIYPSFDNYNNSLSLPLNNFSLKKQHKYG